LGALLGLHTLAGPTAADSRAAAEFIWTGPVLDAVFAHLHCVTVGVQGALLCDVVSSALGIPITGIVRPPKTSAQSLANVHKVQ
jgi:hypothetical protein